jgi:hypothetical protein
LVLVALVIWHPQKLRVLGVQLHLEAIQHLDHQEPKIYLEQVVEEKVEVTALHLTLIKMVVMDIWVDPVVV